MSTKIYDAYKVKLRNQLWPLLKDIKVQGRANVTKNLRTLFWDTMVNYDPTSSLYQTAAEKNKGGSDWAIRLGLAEDELRQNFKEQSGKLTRDFFDLDVSVAVYSHKSGFYLVAYCDTASCLKGSLDFMQKHPMLRDFHYQNQSDQPKGISTSDWNNRKKVWGEIMEGPVLSADAIVSISDWASWWTFNPVYEMAAEWRKKPPKIPTPEQVAVSKLKKSGLRATSTPGLIKVNRGGATIKKGRTKWTVTLKSGPKRGTRVNTLNQAVELVRIEYMPPALKATIQRMMRNARRMHS